jgi:hypothetical protein
VWLRLACLLLLFELVLCLDEREAAVSGVLNLVEEGEGGIVEDAVSRAVDQAMANVRKRLHVTPLHRKATRKHRIRDPGIMPTADGVTNSIELSKNCRKAARMRVLGLTSLAKTFAKQCNHQAVTQLDISIAGVARDQAAEQHKETPAKAAKPPEATATEHQKRHISRKRSKMRQLPDAGESSSTASRSTLEQQIARMKAAMAKQAQQVKDLESHKWTAGVGPNAMQLGASASDSTQGDPVKTAVAAGVPDVSKQSSVVQDLMSREASVIAREQKAIALEQAAKAAEHLVKQEKAAAHQQEQEAQDQAAAETKQASQLLNNARKQAAHDETKAHKEAARMESEASKEAQDLRVQAAVKVHAMEQAAIAEAQKITKQAKVKANAELAEADKSKKETEAAQQAAQAAQQAVTTKLDQKETAAKASLKEQRKQLAEQQRQIRAETAAAKKLQLAATKSQQESQKEAKTAAAEAHTLLEDARHKAKETLQTAQSKLSKVAAKEEGEELKLQADDAKGQAKAAELVEQARQQSSHIANRIKQQAMQQAEQIVQRAKTGLAQQKQKLELERSRIQLQAQQAQDELDQTKAEANAELSNQKQAEQVKIHEEEQKQADRDTAARRNRRKMMAKARSRAKAVVESAEEKAKRLAHKAEAESKQIVQAAEDNADKSKDELKHELAQERKAEERMRKVATAGLEERRKEGKEAAKQVMEQAKSKAKELAREAAQSIKQSKAREAQQEGLDKTHAEQVLQGMKTATQQKVAKELAHAAELMRNEKQKLAEEEEEVTMQLKRNKQQATQHMSEVVAEIQQEQEAKEKQAATIVTQLSIKARQMLKHAQKAANKVKKQAEVVAQKEKQKAMRESQQQHQSALKAAAKAEQLVHEVKHQEMTIESSLAKAVHDETIQADSVNDQVAHQVSKVRSELGAAQKEMLFAKNAKSQLQTEAKQAADKAVMQARHRADKLLTGEKRIAMKMIIDTKKLVKKKAQQMASKETAAEQKLKGMKKQQQAVMANMKQLQAQGLSKAAATAQEEKQQAAKMLATQRKHELAQTADLIEKAKTDAALDANKVMQKALQHEQVMEKKALGEVAHAKAKGEKQLQSKEKALMKLTQAISHKAAKEVDAAHKQAAAAMKQAHKDEEQIQALDRKLELQQDEASTAAHAAAKREKQLRRQIKQAKRKVTDEAADIQKLRGAYQEEKHQVSQVHAANRLLRQKAKSVAKFAKSVATKVAQVNTQTKHDQTLKVGATQVDAELQTDAEAISQLADREADREQEEKRASAIYGAKTQQPLRVLNEVVKAKAPKPVHATPVAATAKALKLANVKHHIRVSLSQKVQLSPRLAHDRDIIRNEHAKVLELRSAIMDAKERVKQINHRQAAWKQIAASPGTGTAMRAMIIAKFQDARRKKQKATAALKKYDKQILVAEKKIRKATKDAANPRGTVDGIMQTDRLISPTQRERAAASVLSKRQTKLQNAHVAARVVAQDPSVIKADQASIHHIKTDLAAAQSQMAKSAKAEKVWNGFVEGTHGVTKQQFALKLRAAQAQESEATDAISSYNKHLEHAEQQLAKDTGHV